MKFISFVLLFFLSLVATVAFSQEHERMILKDEHFAEVCVLHPTKINAHYKFAPDNLRKKGASNASTSQIEITYQNDCSGGSWPDDARTAFEYAASIWETHLDSPVPIRIEANWVPLGENVLGSARPTNVISWPNDEGGLVIPDTWYTIAQASALIGIDLVSQYEDIDYDIVVNMNCEFSDWYMETDANPPSGTLDAVTVLLHEIGHGLGFLGSIEGNPNAQMANWGINGNPIIFDQFALEGSFRQLLDENFFSKPSEELYDALTGGTGGVFFSGLGAEFALDDVRVPLYSPDPYNPGSSYSHLDHQFFSNTENALMRPRLDQALAVHSPGPVFCGMLDDMGWPLGSACLDLIPEEGFLDRAFLEAPSNGSYDQVVQPTLAWQAVDGATEYRVQLAEDFDFENLIFDQNLNETSLTLNESLEFNTIYFWRVQAVSAGGNSKFSSKSRFTTATKPPDSVTLSTPEDEAEQLRPGFELSWQTSGRADQYQIHISEDPDFSQPVIDRTVSAPRFGATQDLEFSTTYYWRVRGVNAAGNGEWSDVRNFTTIIEKPEPVSLNLPSDNQNQVSVTATFSSSESARASEYIFQVSVNESFTSETVIERTSSDPAVTLNNPLDFATIYYWRAKAVNVGGESEWSEVNQFTTVVQETAIMPNYPNPFNSATTIRFQLSEEREVSLDVFDALGRRISVLINEERPPGVYFENLNASGYASGTYFIRFVAGDFMEVQKMAIIK